MPTRLEKDPVSMRILGLDVNDYNTSAAFLTGGRIVSGVQEERLNREKLTRRFPVRSIEYCLEANGCELADLDAVAVSVNPAIYLENLNPVQSERARYRGELLYSVPNYLLGLRSGADALRADLVIAIDGAPDLKVHYVTHHDAHAGAAYYTSPFEEAAVLTVDGFGEKETLAAFRARGDYVERLFHVEFPHSMGCFYAAITEFLGFRRFSEEWKVMGASAYGDPHRYHPRMRRLVQYTGDGRFEVDLSFFNYYQFHRPGWFTDRLVDLLGESYEPGSVPDQRFYDIAAAAQLVLEEVLFEVMKDLHGRVQSENLCLAGGVAMNCVMNGKITANTPFENVYIPPMPDDSGTSLGAALYVYHMICDGTRGYEMEHNFIGPAYTDDEVESELRRCLIRYTSTDDPAAAAAGLISQGKLVGWFQGGVEFGDRALGNRSILADPRSGALKDRIINDVKLREPFRPFAPSILEEHLDDYFVDAVSTPFMERVSLFREEVKESVPAVVHVDGSGRLQTVSRARNRLFYELIDAFKKDTGVPLVLNTSFNLRGEPIVCTPCDALRTFYSCGLDALVLNRFVVEK